MATRIVDLLKQISTKCFGDSTNIPSYLTDDSQIMLHPTDMSNMKIDVSMDDDSRKAYKYRYEPFTIALPSDLIIDNILVGTITLGSTTMSFLRANDIGVNGSAGDSSYSSVMMNPFDMKGKYIRYFSHNTVRYEDIKRLKFTLSRESYFQKTGEILDPVQKEIQWEPFDWLDNPILTEDDVVPSTAS
jgi:hypothetical protein